MRLLSRICRVAGVCWENEVFVTRNKLVQSYIELLLMLTGTRLGLVTWNVIPLNRDAIVAEHTDAENAAKETGLSEVLIAQTVLQHSDGG